MAARKTSVAPTRVWKFHVHPTRETEREIVDICATARRYYNKRVEIHRAKSDRFQAIRRKFSPVLADLEDRREQLDATIEAIFDDVKRQRGDHYRAEGEKRRILPAEAQAQIDALRAQQKTIDAEAKELRAAFKALSAAADAEQKRRSTERAAGGGPTVKGKANTDVLAEMLQEDWPAEWKMKAESEDIAHRELRAARASCGLPIGTYLQTEAAVEVAVKDSLPRPPGFRRFDGAGKIAVQVKDSTYADLLAGTSSCSIMPQPGMRAKLLTLDQSIPRGERRKIVVSVKMHREPPQDAVVKWAAIVVRRQGQRTRMELQLTLEHPSFAEPKRPAGVRAPDHVRIGWAAIKDRGVRVAKWTDGEVVVPSAILAQHDHAALIKSAADTHLDTAVAVIKRWTRMGGNRIRGWESVRRNANRIALRRACESFGAFALGDAQLKSLWRKWVADRRSRGEDLFCAAWLQHRWLKAHGHQLSQQERAGFWLYCWARKDQHLMQYAADSTRRFEARRDAFFRAEAIRIATEFESVTVDSFAISALRELPELTMPGDRPTEVPQHNATAAAPGRFREILRDVMGPRCTPCERPSDDKNTAPARASKRKASRKVAEGGPVASADAAE